ncbi:MAG TPA: glycosyltransferase [Ramlibacter sp.]|nr:glycosyltransferase [Ramlibacter sp.]
MRYLHVTHGAELATDLGEFDAVLQSYCARLPVDGSASDAFCRAMAAYRGVKVIAIQDEYDNTNRLRSRLAEIGYDIVLTCIPEDQVARVYPPEMFPNTRFVPVLTGYVPESLAARTGFTPLAARNVLLGYRGRDIGPRYGRLAFDKFEIGRRMKVECERLCIRHDIEWTEDKRVYGDAWYDFLGSCRAVLGTESGSNVFDWDGEVLDEYRRRGGPSYAEFLPWLAEREAEWDIGQISPRVFEAAACHTPMVLFEGRYSGILEPETHYVALRKDFANVPAVLDRLNRPQELQEMAERAWRHLIAAGRYTYAAFVDAVEEALDDVIMSRGGHVRPALPADRYADSPNDPISLLSVSETPTTMPKPTIYFMYKHTVSQIGYLMRHAREQQDLLGALAARLSYETAEHSREISALRLQRVRAA